MNMVASAEFVPTPLGAEVFSSTLDSDLVQAESDCSALAGRSLNALSKLKPGRARPRPS